MEDRYLYKAKTTPKEKGEFNNVWVTGNLIVSNGKYYIHPVGNVVNVKNELGRIIVMHEVISDTICQCTGLKDMNGRLIWENDVVKEITTINFDSDKAKVSWIESEWMLEWKTKCFYRKDMKFWTSEKIIEVIGNIFDDIELLK